MKKQLLYSLLFSCTLAATGTSCTGILDSENLYGKDLNTYYSTPDEIHEALNGIYNAIYVSNVNSEEAVVANLFDDLMLGGGGTDDITAREMDAFQDQREDTYRDLWISTYNGVYRCNALIERLAEADFSSFFNTEAEAANFRAQALGEAYFMRGFFFFRAARFFGGLPMIVSTDTPRDLPRASVEETFGQIAADFKAAIETFPNKQAADYQLDDFGHANKWIAEGYMGRAYLYYTGYMTNILKQGVTDITLPGEGGGKVSKTDVIGWIEDCRKNSGYKLVNDFRNLWPYAYVNERAAMYDVNGSEPILPWAAKEGLKWAGQDGIHSQVGTGNPEVMFSEIHAFGSWDGDGTAYVSCRACLFFGLRDNTLVPFYQGWGWGSVHPDFYNEWDDKDLRKEGSVLKLGDPENGTGGFEYKTGEQFTGLLNKKYLSLAHNGSDGVKGLFSYIYNSLSTDYQNWSAQNFCYLRFADILLMHSELTGDNSGMNEVRRRAGLEEVPYSLEALKKERMYEFAFEAQRWFDLVRWGDVEGTNNYYKRAAKVVNGGIETTYSVNYRPETKGLVSLPETEIRLSNGVYEQNAGW